MLLFRRIKKLFIFVLLPPFLLMLFFSLTWFALLTKYSESQPSFSLLFGIALFYTVVITYLFFYMHTDSNDTTYKGKVILYSVFPNQLWDLILLIGWVLGFVGISYAYLLPKAFQLNIILLSACPYLIARLSFWASKDRWLEKQLQQIDNDSIKVTIDASINARKTSVRDSGGGNSDYTLSFFHPVGNELINIEAKKFLLLPKKEWVAFENKGISNNSHLKEYKKTIHLTYSCKNPTHYYLSINQ